MATNRQDVIKEGSVEQAAEKIALRRENVVRDAMDRAPIEEPDVIVADELEPEREEIPAEIPAEEAAPLEEDDLFADDLDEAVETQTLDAPAALSKEGKDLFAKADPALQKEVADRLKAAERGATQKVQQVAEKEKEVEALAARVIELRDQLSARLQSLDVTIPEPPDPDLADPYSDQYDPDAFNVQQARYQRAMRDVERNKSERQKVAEENARISQQNESKFRQESARRLVEFFPGWNTQEKFTSGVSSIHDYLVREGIDRQVASKVIDAQMLKIAYKASRYDEIKSQVKAKKPTPKTTSPTGKPSRTQPTTSISEARARLKKSGSLEDAAAVLSATRANRS
ncbi:MAG TPA: hypothetical protein VMW24_21435 [Sedimentisphaerales bacterium]|nr:hypothetical protein [Sedimentisphaerales bacterium]